MHVLFKLVETAFYKHFDDELGHLVDSRFYLLGCRQELLLLQFRKLGVQIHKTRNQALVI